MNSNNPSLFHIPGPWVHPATKSLGSDSVDIAELARKIHAHVPEISRADGVKLLNAAKNDACGSLKNLSNFDRATYLNALDRDIKRSQRRPQRILFQSFVGQGLYSSQLGVVAFRTCFLRKPVYRWIRSSALLDELEDGNGAKAETGNRAWTRSSTACAIPDGVRGRRGEVGDGDFVGERRDWRHVLRWFE
ncbi:hypothetical protein B0H16DRAFT_1452132 [Mycena metata]|uniref:Uncharacterized protein n=1 Tax=Mycena metata TaxID=1033252 RepID=A0AAD7JUC0_9AGAR|nr:hypothetical protein B0H16DRAFT_1452132 [Mycena metata]